MSNDRFLSFADAEWRMSSYSSAGGSCVEVWIMTDVVMVRDSKDARDDRPVLGLDAGGWRSFVGFVAR